MNASIDILRGELERLFSLEEMTAMSATLLGLDPEEVGGASAKASFARALTERCADGDRLEALVDVLVASKKAVDPRLREMGAVYGKDEFAPGTELHGTKVVKKIGESDLAITYQVEREGKSFTLKVLHRNVTRDRAATQRFLTANRLVGTVTHEGLPKEITAGELPDGRAFVRYGHVEGQTLAARFARTGPLHFGELKAMFRAILEPLAALHRAELAHGDLKLENVLVTKAGEAGTSPPAVTLIDFGADRLRHRPTASNGHTGYLAVFGSSKTIAPELVRGRPADARADVYAFGAMAFELLTGKSVFDGKTGADAAFAHLHSAPPVASSKAPSGWVPESMDSFLATLLKKDPAERPRDAKAVLDLLEGLGRARATSGASAVSEADLAALVDKLAASPGDTDVAIALEKAAEDGADATKVAEAFAKAATDFFGAGDGVETKKALYYRAARTFDLAGDKARAEAMFVAILALDESDEVAASGLEEVRKALGKYEEIVEMLVMRSEKAAPGEERARALAEIGRLYAHELDDPEQALVAFLSAVCENPNDGDSVAEIERLAGTDPKHWSEVLAAVTEGTKAEGLGPVDRNTLLALAAGWYDQKATRPDMALMAYQQILATDPANEDALEGLTLIYRRAQQWPELAQILLSRADSAATSPRARDLRAEAAELFETKLNDGVRAKDILAGILADDPGHARASEATARIAEKAGDFALLAKTLEKRAEARRGTEKAEALFRVAEVYEERLSDLAEAVRRYDAVLAIDESHLGALKGLDRVYGRQGKPRELLEVLERQVAIAATPRQKINLHERIANLYDEEFLDHENASAAYEAILALDATNDNALTQLARHYRAQNLWEDLAKLYERHAATTGDETRRVDILTARARVLAEQIGSPERATKAFELVLERSPGNAGALEALARLRELAGDAHAALSAIESLAAKAETAEGKAEQWMRAGRLLEARGDKDGAIERFKLALEANPRDPAAAAALRSAYAQRGDVASVVSLIDVELGHAEGNLAKSRLHAELAKIHHQHMADADRAESAAKRALDLDATNADALMVLGDVAFEAGRYIEASRYYESLVGRSSVLSKDDGVRVLLQFVEASGKANGPTSIPNPPMSMPASSMPASSMPMSTARLSQPPPAPGSATRIAIAQGPAARVAVAIEALEKLAPGDSDVLARVARVVFEFGDVDVARRMNMDLLEKHGRALSSSERAAALYRIGESARRAGDVEGALKPLKDAADADPTDGVALAALGKVYEAKGDWEAAILTRQRRLEVATGNERFELLLEIGDIESIELKDRSRASASFVQALEERPDDRRLLTKLMQLYSEEKDWARLVEVVLRLADFVEDPKQRAKYMHTAAIVSSRQIGDHDAALTYYEKAIEFDPALTKAVDEALEIRRQKSDHAGVERLLRIQLDHAKDAGDRTKITAVLDQLGALYQKFLNDPELAIDAYEAAHAFDPEDKARMETLAELYASDPALHLEKAVRFQAQILKRNPYRIESYRLLRRLYTEAKRPDAAWCLCQALAVLNLAEPDEERFYGRHRAESAAPAQSAFDDNDWSTTLAHADLDPIVTRIFALIQPTIIRTRNKPFEELGFDLRYALDLSLHPYPVSQTLHYATSVLGIAAPPVFQNKNDGGGLGFVHAATPAIQLGRASFEVDVSPQAMAFLAGRHLAYFRPGYYVRHLVPTGTGLKAWLFAAIKMSVPQFPITADLQGQVQEAMAAMVVDFQGAQKERLASLVSKLLQSGATLDLKRWVAAVDATADRAGFVLAHDLEVATEVMRATEDSSSIPAKERMKDIVLFAVSEEYFAVRSKLQVTVD
ncbi:MAG: protein kinase [Polyangiaceae bacterium]